MGQQKRASQPIVRHPLFPSVVALWFGALFAFAGLVISPVVLEKAVLASGIDAIVPAAAPPLGMTARILVALALLVVGAFVGLKTGRALAAPKPVARERRRGPAVATTAAPARPLSIRDDVGTLDAIPQEPSAGPAGRRRGLTATEDDSLDRFDDIAPLPGGPPQVLGLMDLEVKPAMAPGFDPGEDRPRFAPLLPAVADISETPAEVPEATTEPVPAEPLAMAEAPIERPFAAPSPEPVAPTPAPHAEPVASPAPRAEFAPPRGAAAERIASAEIGALSNVELIERLALSLQRRRELDEARRAEALQVAAPAPEPSMRPHLAAAAESGAAASFAAPPPAASAPLARFAPPAANEAPAQPLPTLPLALRPLAFADDLDHADELPAFVPARHISLPGAAADSDEDEPDCEPIDEAEADYPTAGDAGDAADDMLEDGYSSLLALSRAAPAREPCIRIEDPDPIPAPSAEPEPVVVFPGQAMRPALDVAASRTFDPPEAAAAPAPAAAAVPVGPDETEQALRAALATLQRMSGAA